MKIRYEIELVISPSDPDWVLEQFRILQYVMKALSTYTRVGITVFEQE